VNCVVVVVRKTIGPFEREAEDLEGIEYDMELLVGRVPSELIPRPIRTMISEKTIPIMGDVMSKKILKVGELVA